MHYYFWTDGSSSLRTGVCGWAAIGLSGQHRTILLGHRKGTNQQAELLAIFHALSSTPEQAQIYLKTDSEYAINCIVKYRKAFERDNFLTSSGMPVKNLDIIQPMWALCDRRVVRLQHVRGHKGFAGNEAADFIAKIARKLGEDHINREQALDQIAQKIVSDSVIFVV